ncbi:hypothetical protein [Phenylobacterium sp.]|uniref:hypothetical protein n=1 Tax=Phenylobacterium sp. TaxID=1871053 RepID=UPI0035AFC97A
MTPATFRAPWRLPLWALIAAALVAPAVAMRFTDEMAWTAGDFLAAGGLLVGAGLAWELAAWRLRRPLHRMIAAAVIAAAVLGVWAEGAVGIF